MGLREASAMARQYWTAKLATQRGEMSARPATIRHRRLRRPASARTPVQPLRTNTEGYEIHVAKAPAKPRKVSERASSRSSQIMNRESSPMQVAASTEYGLSSVL